MTTKKIETADEHPLEMRHVLLCPICSTPGWTCKCGVEHKAYVDMCGDCGTLQVEAEGGVAEVLR